MKKASLAIALAAALAFTSPSRAETLTNASVVTMAQVGLGPDAIIAKIKTSPNAFDLSTDQLIALKKAGVPDAVIAAMLNASVGGAVSASAAVDSTSPDPKAPHAGGIYLLEAGPGAPHMERIDATHSNQTKSSGVLAYAFTYGIAHVKIKTVLPNPTARVRTNDPRPAFYFYFDEANAGISGNRVGGVWLPGAVTSPSEFSLVRFEVNNGEREAVLGQFNITGMKTGVMDNARVDFSYDDVSPGVFKVTPSADLPPGEYAFVYSVQASGSALGGSASARIFDFAVTK
jgi:hypothetical protein